MASKPIRPTDESYSTIFEDWVREGRPHQFDRYADEDISYGGATYRVIDVSEEEPVFYQYASMVGTTYDEDNKGKATKGWEFINEDHWQQTGRVSRKGRVSVDFKDAPNDL